MAKHQGTTYAALQARIATLQAQHQDLAARIAALQKQAEDAWRKEVAGVVGRIKEAIDHYGLTAADLGLRVQARPGASKARQRRAAEVRFRDEAGNEWSGRGRRPQWFVDALAAGKTREDLAA